MLLSDRKCKELRPKAKPYKATDGGSMYLEVMPNGSKYWRMNYRFLGKPKRLAFGVYPFVSLKEARDKRTEAKKLLAEGIDPSEHKKLKKLELINGYENTFEVLAREWHENRNHAWQPKHAARILKRLETYIFPFIGSRPIKAVAAPELLAALRKVEERGNHEQAHRLMQTCGQVFRFAVATGRAERNLTSDLSGALKPVKSQNHAHLKEKELPAFLRELAVYDTKYRGKTITRLAFQLLILTFVRSVEIRGAKWDEFDFEKAEWRIPAERMKVKSPHIVPLAKQSIQLLGQIKTLVGDNFGNFVFPSNHDPKQFMSENTFMRAIEVMGYKGRTTAHGFRSVASTILNESGFPPDVIERQLAHCERDQVRGAYNHAEYLKERHKMMIWWADYLEKVAD